MRGALPNGSDFVIRQCWLDNVTEALTLCINVFDSDGNTERRFKGALPIEPDARPTLFSGGCRFDDYTIIVTGDHIQVSHDKTSASGAGEWVQE